MARLAVIMAVYNEGELLPDALESIDEAGIELADVHVFDGAWRGGKDGALVFDGAAGPSTDATREIALASGCTVHAQTEPWGSQEEKRNAMFDVEADYFLVMDADERLEGCWPAELPDGHANVMMKCVGPNDMPGIRGEWPHGDYYPDYKPEIRLFRNRPDLEMLYPGGYYADGAIIQAYSDAAGTSALPILEGVSMTHHGNLRSPERIAAKIDYYKAEHPVRRAWQKALAKAGIR